MSREDWLLPGSSLHSVGLRALLLTQAVVVSDQLGGSS